MKKDFKFRDSLKKNLLNYNESIWSRIEENIYSIIRNKLSYNFRIKLSYNFRIKLWNTLRDNIESNIRNIKMREILKEFKFNDSLIDSKNGKQNEKRF